MDDETQISAMISRSTKELLDKFVQEEGMKKGHVIEQALLDYLRAMAELPPEAILPAKIVITRQSARLLARRLAAPKPTRALRNLMK